QINPDSNKLHGGPLSSLNWLLELPVWHSDADLVRWGPSHCFGSQADIVIENYRPGTMERLGLAYATLQEENPRPVYCKITGFGSDGPYAQRAGYDLISQVMSGIIGLTGEGPGRPPVKVGVPVGDVTAGILAATGVLAAYIEVLRTGEAQLVDTSLLEASLVHTYWPAALAFATGLSAGPMGSAHPVAAPYQTFLTSDGWINVGAISQGKLERIALK
ncbi:MAG: L-carnitine dehydratase/bile acid-inducible protein, partial [Herminiimonas sp.]|nr:L-carnitine dehydratase/bile acid-inducible protein [Herminiimonas sp.]